MIRFYLKSHCHYSPDGMESATDEKNDPESPPDDLLPWDSYCECQCW